VWREKRGEGETEPGDACQKGSYQEEADPARKANACNQAPYNDQAWEDSNQAKQHVDEDVRLGIDRHVILHIDGELATALADAWRLNESLDPDAGASLSMEGLARCSPERPNATG